ncbi:unnamed protein product [Eruca vesicaria subsp. sativa]|uniref:Uncharacterized protein n=1 Tax=Eruca vesicaria subsp. sativa TaxID=29727 RepID=A0ABC8JME9_ERUVS|nr:unnamed protein product [Eruca vesicaria subsp. sativa]
MITEREPPERGSFFVDESAVEKACGGSKKGNGVVPAEYPGVEVKKEPQALRRDEIRENVFRPSRRHCRDISKQVTRCSTNCLAQNFSKKVMFLASQ